MRTDKPWTHCRELVQSLSLEVFEPSWVKPQATCSDLTDDPALGTRLHKKPPEVPFHLNYPIILELLHDSSASLKQNDAIIILPLVSTSKVQLVVMQCKDFGMQLQGLICWLSLIQCIDEQLYTLCKSQSSNTKAVSLESIDVPGRNPESNIHSIPHFVHTFNGVINSAKSSVTYEPTYFDVFKSRIF